MQRHLHKTRSLNTCYLVVNAGSSSIKLAVYQSNTLALLASAEAKLIGQATASLTTWHQAMDKPLSQAMRITTQLQGHKITSSWLLNVCHDVSIVAVGHRIVHGGTLFSKPTRLTAHTIRTLGKLSPFDPVHMTAQLQAVRFYTRKLPKATPVACFDTAFCHDLPELSQLIPLPKAIRDLGVRTYGFHGLSYESIYSQLHQLYGTEADRLRIIIAHLGSGSSLVAMQNGKPVDTTMSFSTNSGIAMSSRSGDLDPNIASFVRKKTGTSYASFTKLANNSSGLLGLSGTSADMKHLLAVEAHDAAASLAVSYYCKRVSQAIASLTTTLGGLDMLIFTGGIGQQSATIRERISHRLTHLGVQNNGGIPDAIGLEPISHGKVVMHVVNTQEELTIARHIKHVLTI